MKLIKILKLINFILSIMVIIAIPVFYFSDYDSILELIAGIIMVGGTFSLSPLNIINHIIETTYNKKHPIHYEIKQYDGEKWNKIGDYNEKTK